MTWIWIVVAVVAIAAVYGVWIGNTVRWTKRNGNLARRSPGIFGRSDEVDEFNRTRR
ncbi:hypothetical protein [Geodermatophilus sp. FMUSA9-8]|uniref:hypothetical protein n=1 Tax=Geodermatophilus sp. FMUSA9-8 TaxID=3120155 RepID=UPI00300BA3EF